MSERVVVPEGMLEAAMAAYWGRDSSVVEWQRRMFRAPEPEVPEAVKDLLERLEAARMGVAFQSAQAAILEAYRRGLRGK